MRNLVLAGGVALNCVANGRLLREGPFERIWIQPAAGDAGAALGIALLLWHRYRGEPREVSGHDRMSASLLGPAFGEAEIEAMLREKGADARRLGEENLVEETAELLARGKVVGWFQGRMEFGPRALGSRSILGDPRNEEMQKTLNLKIKFRESFRPFAPAVLRERVADYFELDQDSPYMLIVADVQAERRLEAPAGAAELEGLDRLRIPRSDVPAVTHVDYSARVQTVDGETQPLFHALLRAFERRTGCPVLVNTSFNVRGEPIVCTPEDAWRCFLRTDMDYLALGPFLLDKRRQPQPEEDLAAGPLELD